MLEKYMNKRLIGSWTLKPPRYNFVLSNLFPPKIIKSSIGHTCLDCPPSYWYLFRGRGANVEFGGFCSKNLCRYNDILLITVADWMRCCGLANIHNNGYENSGQLFVLEKSIIKFNLNFYRTTGQMLFITDCYLLLDHVLTKKVYESYSR